ncbi:alpha/beta hydrolase-fold protein [Candidatus Margulisiibacteriota bacterium]
MGYLNLKKYLFVLVLLLLLIPTHLFAKIKYLNLKKSGRAIVYIPASYYQKANRFRRYPLLIALHGLRETSEQSLGRYQKIANNLNMILVCPRASSYRGGYTRKPKDDREKISYLFDYMVRNYRIRKNKSVLVGFSRGGHIAVEIGLMYPAKFRNVVCMFGFFDKRHERMLKNNLRRYKRLYKRSRFYFITGKGDLSQRATNLGYRTMKNRGIKTKLKTYPNLLHGIPRNIGIEIKRFLRI